MKKFFSPLAVALPLLAACARTVPGGSGGEPDCGGAGGSYAGPDASPICGSETYENACHEWRTDAIPYCYGPAGVSHGDVGPAPFSACVMLLGPGAPLVERNERGWASWWCCPFHNDGDGGTVTLDGAAGQ